MTFRLSRIAAQSIFTFLCLSFYSLSFARLSSQSLCSNYIVGKIVFSPGTNDDMSKVLPLSIPENLKLLLKEIEDSSNESSKGKAFGFVVFLKNETGMVQQKLQNVTSLFKGDNNTKSRQSSKVYTLNRSGPGAEWITGYELYPDTVYLIIHDPDLLATSKSPTPIDAASQKHLRVKYHKFMFGVNDLTPPAITPNGISELKPDRDTTFIEVFDQEKNALTENLLNIPKLKVVDTIKYDGDLKITNYTFYFQTAVGNEKHKIGTEEFWFDKIERDPPEKAYCIPLKGYAPKDVCGDNIYPK